MGRAVLLLIILAGLALFVLQNLAPMPLVILGLRTQAFPVGVWVLGAIAAGAFTTIVISTFFKVSNSFAAPRSRRRPAPPRPTERVTSSTASSSWSPPWSSSPPKPKTSAGSTSRYASSNGDDWEPRPPLEEWEDWEGYEEPAKTMPQSQSSTQGYSSASTSERPDRYSAYAPNPPVREQEEWDDWDDYEQPTTRDSEEQSSRRDVDDEYYSSRRTEFEVPQEPKRRSQSGSIYSYSYRDPDQTVSKDDVYDAEYRVITPPYRPEEVTPEPVDSVPPRGNDGDWRDEEDWGDGEDWSDGEDGGDWGDEPGKPGTRPKP
jgi:uncharacterized integral membrane protein